MEIALAISTVGMMLLIVAISARLEFYLKAINSSLFEVRRSLLNLEEQEIKKRIERGAK